MEKINLDKIKKEKSTKDLINFSIINIDKPTGPTSFSVSQFFKKELSLTKTSHLGTLDPIVTGVLPIALGRACRLSEYLMHRNKTYVGIMRVHKEVNEIELNKAIQKYIGKINQLPPKRSSVKRAIRQREVLFFNILEINGQDILFETEVQAGTYIRKLCDDMGKEIGGAHMLELRRTKAGLFEESKMYNLYQFEEAVKKYKSGDDKPLREMLIPGEIVSELIPVLNIEKQTVKKVLTGSPIFHSFLKDKSELKDLKEGDKIVVFSDGIFIGCYNFIGKDNILAKPEFVFN